MFWTSKVVFIHLPRTGGTWLTEWAQRHLACSVDILWGKHSGKPPKPYPELQPFTIIRPLEERAESFYRHVQDSKPSKWATKEWNESLERLKQLSKQEIAEWLEKHDPTLPKHVKVFHYESPLIEVVDWLCEVHDIEFSDPNARQVGGSHYKSAIQHWDYVLANNIPYMEAQIIKYVTRWRKKNGLEDLEKAKHFLEKLIDYEQGS